MRIRGFSVSKQPDSAEARYLTSMRITCRESIAFGTGHLRDRITFQLSLQEGPAAGSACSNHEKRIQGLEKFRKIDVSPRVYKTNIALAQESV